MAKLKLKNKKKLPKFFGGGIYEDQVNFGNDSAAVQRVTSTRTINGDREASSNRIAAPQITASATQGTTSSMNMDAGKMTQDQGTSGTTQGTGISANQAAGYAQMAGNLAKGLSAGNKRRPEGDFRDQQIQQQDAVMGVVGQMGPVGGVIQGVYNVGQSIGDPIRQSAEAMDQQAAEKGQAKLKNKEEAKTMAVVGSFFDPFKAIQARSSYEGGWTDITGEGYAKHLEKKEQERLDELNRPKREAEIADRNNKLAYGTFRKGGMTYPTNAIPMHGNQGAWAVPLFANGGETFQVDGPSHEQGGVVIPTPNGDYYEVEKQEVIKRESNADKILSDKLKDKESGKTYALAQKPYEKLKEQVAKFKSDSAKAATEEYASQNFDKLYNRQEMEKSLKQKLQLERDFFKCGGMVKYKDGGIHIKPENRGKFTAAANRAGMGVQEYANHILANKEDFSSTLVKRANFVDNAKDWNRNGGIEQYQDGGRRGKPTDYSEAVLVDPSKITPDYKFTQRTTEDLGGGRTKVTNLYNKPLTEKAIPSKMSSTTPPSPDWEKSIIDRLQSGVTTDDLVKQGFIGHEGAKKYAQYYRPLKTEITQEAPKQEARLYGEKTIAGKLQPKGYAEQPWDTYITNPEAGQANVQTIGHYYRGRPIDPLRSFDSTGKIFTPAYLDEGASTGTYLQQQGTEMHRNPLEVMPGSKTTNLMSSSVNRYGGIQRFDGGGKKEYLSTYAEGEDPKLYTLEDAANNAFWRNQYPENSNTPSNPMNPNNPYASTFNFNMPIGGPLDQAIMRDKNQSYASDGIPANAGPASSPNVSSNNQQETSPANKAEGQRNNSGSNWKEGAYQLGTGLANNMGELYALLKASNPVEVQARYDYTPKLLNNTAAERAAWRMYKNTADSLKNAGLSSGQYVSNLAANRARLTEQLDESRINRENVNAGIENQAQQYNIAGRYNVDDINAKNRAAKENLQLKATERMGTNIAQQSKDYRSTQQEKQMLPFLQKAFSDPAFQQMFAKWMASQGVG